jgi:membrane associated rhomboid family serine protease
MTLVITATTIWVYQKMNAAIDFGIYELMNSDFAFSWAQFKSHPIGSLPHLITYTFMHADYEHIKWNMIFFLAFAPAVERAMGHFWFTVAYFAAGAAGALTESFFTPFVSNLVGASAAVAGVMGAFFVMFPLNAQIYWATSVGSWARKKKEEMEVYRRGHITPLGFSFLWFFVEMLNLACQVIGRIPSFIYVGWWFVQEFRLGYVSVTPQIQGVVTNVAHWAHVGGFVAGAIAASLFQVGYTDFSDS